MDDPYSHRMHTSLSEHQMEDMGGDTTNSAVSVIKCVLAYVVRSQQEIYNAHYSQLTDLGPTVKPDATKDRFRLYQDRLTEVRYHPSFELKTAIKVLARVLQCDTFMSNSVMSTWAGSAQDQQALTAVISEVRRELAIPVTKYNKPDKDKYKTDSGSRGSGRNDRNSSGGRNGGNSGNWQSRGSNGGKGADIWSSRNSGSQSSSNSSHGRAPKDGMCNAFAKYGECSYGSRCRFRHDEAPRPGIHQIVATQFDRQFKRVANMIENQRDEMRREFEGRLDMMICRLICRLCASSLSNMVDLVRSLLWHM